MDRRIRKTRLLIRTAFIELIKQKELSAITITELAKRADIDRRTFYLHYTCVEDVLTDIEKESVAALNELLSSMSEFNISVFFKGIQKIFSDNIELLRIISTNEHYHSFLTKSKEYIKDVMCKTFFSGSGLSKEEFEIYSEYIASGTIGIYCNWMASQPELPLEELTQKAELAVGSTLKLLVKNKN